MTILKESFFALMHFQMILFYKNKQKNPRISGGFSSSTRGRTRTGTPLLAMDFKYFSESVYVLIYKGLNGWLDLYVHYMYKYGYKCTNTIK